MSRASGRQLRFAFGIGETAGKALACTISLLYHLQILDQPEYLSVATETKRDQSDCVLRTICRRKTKKRQSRRSVRRLEAREEGARASERSWLRARILSSQTLLSEHSYLAQQSSEALVPLAIAGVARRLDSKPMRPAPSLELLHGDRSFDDLERLISIVARQAWAEFMKPNRRVGFRERHTTAKCTNELRRRPQNTNISSDSAQCVRKIRPAVATSKRHYTQALRLISPCLPN